LNPEFHEEFVYKVPLDTLLSMSLEISVWDHNMTRNAFLGGFTGYSHMCIYKYTLLISCY